VSAAPIGAELEPAPVAPSSGRTTRPLLWSVRRELWESRVVVVAPLAVAALVGMATAVSLLGLGDRWRAAADPAVAHALVAKPFGLAPAPIMLAAFLVGLFYALDALHGERRDRSLLFWKSLPVSDRTAVIAKAAIPIVVLPAYAFLLSLATLAVLLLVGTAIFASPGDPGPAVLWREVHWLAEPVFMIYGLAVHALWFAPVYAWLLLVSAWARRLPLLWAALPPVALAAIEAATSGTKHVATFLGRRATGAMETAFAVDAGRLERLDQLTPLRFLASPGLWLGLAFAAGCLALAVRLRRSHVPL
jgi:ABC-2 type transport system permease protein